jgi:hypothetical protein
LLKNKYNIGKKIKNKPFADKLDQTPADAEGKSADLDSYHLYCNPTKEA